MKNKKEEQIAAKKKHIEQLKKKRKTEPDVERAMPILKEKPTILIVCEGQNTEPSYFNQFRLSSATVKPVGEGYNTITLVNRAIQLANEKSYEQVWCVFDKDDFSDNDFNNAIAIAQANNFGIAYSNQAFEYWLILHFNDHQGGGMHRDDYNDKINELIKPFKVLYDGKKSKLIDEDFFELLDDFDEKTDEKRVDLAIRRAERNYNQHNHSNPSKEESTTTVFKLVQELLRYV
ncbi:RloB family protein [Tamlana flava]|uniref:RloB family protein n=1 Tax=Tamlana flava TaxID=3158572 RepID=UPI00351AE53A